MNKLTIVLGLLAVSTATAQVDFSEKSFDRKELKKELKAKKKDQKHKLIVEVAPDYDANQSLTIEGAGTFRFFGKGNREVFEEAFFAEGFNIIDRSTVDKRFKISKRGKVMDEGEIAIGRTKNYNSNYILRFRAKDKTFKIGGIARKWGEVANFDLDIIDLSQGGKIVARAQYKGKALPPEVFYPALARELRNQINKNN